MNLTPELITAIGTAIIVPIITLLKTTSDTNKRKEKRDIQIALMEKRIADVEQKCDGIEELKNSINAINLSLAKIQTILELYIKQHERD